MDLKNNHEERPMIGIFDSGIGGLTVVKTVFQQLPDYEIVYFGDTARTPYGTKSPATIIDYAIQDTDFLLSKGAKIIVVACNTASSVATEALRDRFPGVPIFEVVTPAVVKVTQVTKNHNVGVIGTRATVNSNIYDKKIKDLYPDIKVFSNACPLLVPLVEEGWLKRRETKMILKKYLYPLKRKQIDTLVLGCTHYPLLKDIIQAKMGKRVKIVDSSAELAVYIKNYLTEHPEIDVMLKRGDNTQFYVSDLTPTFAEIAKKILGRPIHLLLA